MLSKTRMLLIAVAILLPAVLLAQGPPPGGGPDHRNRAKMEHKIKTMKIWKMTEELELTEDQSTRFFPMLNEMEEQSEEIEKSRREIIREMGELVWSNEPDDDKVNKLLNELEELEVKQLEILGEWYKPRKELFINASAMRYRGMEPPGVRAQPSSIKAIASKHGKDTLLHLINMHGATRPLKLTLKGSRWQGIKRVHLEPGYKELEVKRSSSRLKIKIKPEEIDMVDTIIRMEF